ncbi:MAG: histidine kinase N-terminal domain-containing protein, partial [Anaerolineae bacterium]|nr:histidine kinase N-terminal domain-containing protein [Anaerolineae bacterium]
MDVAVLGSCGLKSEDIAFLERVEKGMPIVTDISRADILLYCRRGENEAVVVAQARPHSVAPIYEPICGQVVSRGERPALFRTLESGKPARASQRIIADGAPVFQEMLPLFGPQRSLLGALSVE